MFKPSARFALPLVLAAAMTLADTDLFGQSNADKKRENKTKKAVTKPAKTSKSRTIAIGATYFFINGVQRADKLRETDALIQHERRMTTMTAPYNNAIFIGDGEAPLDTAGIAKAIRDTKNVNASVYNIAINLRAANEIVTKGDSTYRLGQRYRNDPNSNKPSSTLGSGEIFAALGESLSDIADKDDQINICLYSAGGLSVLGDARRLPPGTILLVCADTESPVVHPGYKAMDLMNPALWPAPDQFNTPRRISPSYFLETVIAASDAQNKFSVLYVSDEPVEALVRNGVTLAPAGHRVYVTDPAKVARDLPKAHKKTWDGMDGNYLSGTEASLFKRMLKKLDRKKLPLDSINGLKKNFNEDNAERGRFIPIRQGVMAMGLEWTSQDNCDECLFNRVTEIVTGEKTPPRYKQKGVGVPDEEILLRDFVRPVSSPSVSISPPK